MLEANLFSAMAEVNPDRPVLVEPDGPGEDRHGPVEVGSSPEVELARNLGDEGHVQVLARKRQRDVLEVDPASMVDSDQLEGETEVLSSKPVRCC